MTAPFLPIDDASLTLSVSNTTAVTAIKGLAGINDAVLRLRNPTASDIWFRFGTGTVQAASSDINLPAGCGPELFSVPPGATHIAAITATSGATGSLYGTTGKLGS